MKQILHKISAFIKSRFCKHDYLPTSSDPETYGYSEEFGRYGAFVCKCSKCGKYELVKYKLN